MPFTSVGDIEIYYEEYGPSETDASDRLPVLNISGSGGDLRVSKPAPHPLNKHFRTIHFDQRGLGQTSKPAEQWTMAEYADDAVGLLDVLGIEQAHVVGTSFGGMVAQHLALRHPTRAARLVIACSASGGAGGASADLLAAAKLPPEEATLSWINRMDTRWSTLEDIPKPMRSWFAGRADRVAAMDDETRRGAHMQLVARSKHDTWDDLHRIDHETFVIGGQHDGQAPPQNLRNLTERLPNATLEFFDGGHLFFLQDPAAWKRVIAFLNA